MSYTRVHIMKWNPLHVMHRKPVRVIIEGNIGSGKSTVLNKLADMPEFLKFKLCLEPLHEWNDTLELFYQDPERWAFTMNLTALCSMKEIDAVKGNVLQERSKDSARWVFAEALRKTVMPQEYNLMHKVYTLFSKPTRQRVVHIYIRTTPEVCFSRLQTRDSVDAKTVSLEYLKTLHAFHEKEAVRRHWIVINGNQHPSKVTADVSNACKMRH